MDCGIFFKILFRTFGALVFYSLYRTQPLQAGLIYNRTFGAFLEWLMVNGIL